MNVQDDVLVHWSGFVLYVGLYFVELPRFMLIYTCNYNKQFTYLLSYITSIYKIRKYTFSLGETG